jgi:hypothetical protein
MTDENGILSIDFLVGFTIFMLAFIWVVTMIPGLMIGLQSYTIDYDAVAYRTGVILVEDPGWPVSPPWESFLDPQKNSVTRFGLAISKDTPDILSQDKVNRFFCETAFIYPDDYHTRAVFGDYPYGFNISLTDIGGQNRSVGDVLPDGYGYIRRVVKIKGTSNATINVSNYKNADPVKKHVFSILIDNPKLLRDVTDPAYQIDPSREQIMINITNFYSTNSTCGLVDLSNVKIFKLDAGLFSNVPLPASNYPFVDGSSSRLSSSWPAIPAPVNDSVTIKLNPQFIDSMKAQYSQIFIALNFGTTYNCTFLNNTIIDSNDYPVLNNSYTTPFNYNYDPTNVTQPYLRDAVLEVAVWSGAATRSGGSLPTPINGSYMIWVTPGFGGAILPGSVSVNDGANQTFNITPNIGHHITDVSVDSVPQGAVTTYTFNNVVGEHMIAASFAFDAPTFTSIAPAAGPTAGSTPVTITGTNLTGATGVTFGGTPATGITVVNVNTITATTPAHAAGTVNVVVTTPGGTATGTNVYTYVAPPTFTSIAPPNGPVAGGTAVTIVGSNFVSGGSFGVTIGGVAATIVVRVDATHITARTPAGTLGSKNVVITNNDGQTVPGPGAYTYV